MTFEISEFLLALVLMAFAWVALDFLLGRFNERWSIRCFRRKKRDCHLCGKTYQENSRVKLSFCPDCAAGNTRKGHRRLG